MGTLSMMFIGVKETHDITSFELSEHETQYIGRLKEFNTLEVLETWRKNNLDIEKLFTMRLKCFKWNFTEYPNPIGVLVKPIE